MAKKSKLNGFVFKKLDEISDGLKIPTGNAINYEAPPVELSPEPVIAPPVKPVPTQQQVSKRKIEPLRKLPIDSKAFTPMTNVVPTIEAPVVVTKRDKLKRLSRKAKQRVLPEDLNMNEYGALPDKHAKILYLAMRGWSLKVEQRGNTFYHYATRYIKRKKKRLYLGSVNE